MDTVQITDQIERATRTIKKLPRVGVRTRYCNWPDVVQNFFDAYGYTEVTIKIIPTARQLTELDQVIDWLAWLSQFGDEYTRIVWARAAGYSWRRIAYMAGLAPDTCKERFRIGVTAIYWKLNGPFTNSLDILVKK